MTEPYYASEHVTVYEGDCLDVLAGIPDASIDSVVTDPPYGLDFMGKHWDTGAVAFDTAVWGHALRVLKPGGHCLAFGGSRTWHRLAAAIEDAGFEIRDSIAWLYGSGFPKSLDVSKAIDKRPGVARHAEFAAELKAARLAAGYTNSFDVSELVIGGRTGAVANWEKYQFPESKWWPALRDLLGMDGAKWDGVIAEAARDQIGTHAATRLAVAPGQGNDRSATRLDITAPATDAAKQWQGWGTALKPAFEPIVVGRKPIRGTVAANVVAHGTGALNIDGCRVATGEDTRRPFGTPSDHVGQLKGLPRGELNPGSTLGRWPTNVVIDEHTAAGIDEQSGVVPSAGIYAKGSRHTGAKAGPASIPIDGHTSATYDDSGGASRFFPTFRYEAKAPTAERPSVVKTMLRLRADLTPEQVDLVQAHLREAGVQVD